MASQATNSNKADGTRAEEYVARQVGGERTPNGTHDVETPGGDPLEAKSTTAELSSGRHGRFRLWRSQHEELKDEGGRYWFLVDGDGREIPEDGVKEMDPETVEEVIEAEGLSWTGSGSHHMDTEQVKIPWPYLLDR